MAIESSTSGAVLVLGGPAGLPGPMSTVPGPAGPASTIPGPAGPASTVPGPKGDPGIGIMPKGSFATLSALPATASPGDTYIASADDTATPKRFSLGDGLVWVGTGGDLGPGGNYHNVGPVRGPKGDPAIVNGVSPNGAGQIVLTTTDIIKPTDVIPGDAGALTFLQAGANAQKRALTKRFQEGTVSLEDYKLPADTDDTAAWQRAHDALSSAFNGGTILLPARDIVIGGTVNFSAPVFSVGMGWGENVGAIGTRVVLTSTSASPFNLNNTSLKGVRFSNFSISQSLHPAPPMATVAATVTSGQQNLTGVTAGTIQAGAALTGTGIPPGTNAASVSGTTVSMTRAATASGSAVTITYYNPWTPASYPVVFNCQNTGGMLWLDHLMCCGINSLVVSYNSGRLIAEWIYGHIFNTAIDIDLALDCCRIDQIHQWPYFSTYLNVFNYTQANADLILLGRIDTPFIDNIFHIYGRYVIRFKPTAAAAPFAGTVATRIHIGKVQADGCLCGLYIPSGVNGVWANILLLDAQCEGPPGGAIGLNGSSGIIIQGNNAILNFGVLNTQYTGGAGLFIDGSNNTVNLGNSYFGIWGTYNTAFPAVYVNNNSTLPSIVRCGTLPVFIGGGGNSSLVNSSTNAIFDGFPPITFTSTVTAVGGTYTSASANGAYQRMYGRIFGDVDVNVVTNGTAASGLYFSLPFTVGSRYAVGFGRDIAKNITVIATLNPGATNGYTLKVSDGTHPSVDGSRFIMSYNYSPAQG